MLFFFVNTVWADYSIDNNILNIFGSNHSISDMIRLELYIQLSDLNIDYINISDSGGLTLDRKFKSNNYDSTILTNINIEDSSVLNLGDNDNDDLTVLTVSNAINIINSGSKLNFINDEFKLSTNVLNFRNVSGSISSAITNGIFSNITNFIVSDDSQLNLDLQVLPTDKKITNLTISNNSQLTINSQISVETTVIGDNAKLIFANDSIDKISTIKIDNSDNAVVGFSNGSKVSIGKLELNNIGSSNTSTMITSGNFQRIENVVISSSGETNDSVLIMDSNIADSVEKMDIIGNNSRIIFATDIGNQIKILAIDHNDSVVTINDDVSNKISLNKLELNSSDQNFNDNMITGGIFYTIDEFNIGANTFTISNKDIAKDIKTITVGDSNNIGEFNINHTIAEKVEAIEVKDKSIININVDPSSDNKEKINLNKEAMVILNSNSLELKSISFNGAGGNVKNTIDSIVKVDNLVFNSGNFDLNENIFGKFQTIDKLTVNNSFLIYNNIHNTNNESDLVANSVNNLILADENSSVQIGDIVGNSTKIVLQSLESNLSDITFVDPESSITASISGNVNNLKFISGKYSSIKNAKTTNFFDKINNFYITDAELELDRSFSNSVDSLFVGDKSILILDDSRASFLNNTKSIFGKDSLLTIKLFGDVSDYATIKSNDITLDSDSIIKFHIFDKNEIIENRHLGLTFASDSYDMNGFGVMKTLDILNYEKMNKNFIITTEGKYDNLYEIIYQGNGKYNITKRLADSTSTELKILDAIQRVRFETIPTSKVKDYIDYLVSLMSTSNTTDPTEITRALRASVPNDDFKQRIIRNNIFNIILQSVNNRLIYGNFRRINRYRKNTRLNPYYHYEEMYEEQQSEHINNLGLSAGDTNDVAKYETISLWSNGIYGMSKMSHEKENFKGFKTITKGVIGGLEVNLSRFLTLGGGYLFSSTKLTEKDSKETIVDSQGIFGYGRFRIGNFYINGVGSTMLLNTKDESKFIDPSTGVYNTDYKTTAFYLQTVVGYNFMLSGIVFPWETEKILDHKKILYGITPPYIVISPEIGFRISSSIQDSYGDSIGFQTVPKNNENILTAVAGFKIHKVSATTDDILYQYYFHIDLAKDLKSNIKNEKTIDLFGGLTYSLLQRKSSDYTIEFGVGISFDLLKHLELSLNYEGRYTKRYIENNATAGFRLKF